MTMVIEEALYTYLTTEAGVSALIGARLYPLVIPQDIALPAAAYQRISGPRELAHDGPTGMARGRFQFTCQAATYGEVKDLANAIRQALDGYSGLIEDVVVERISTENELDGYEFSGEVRTVRLDVMVMYQENYFDPRSISGCLLWLDAASGVYSDTGLVTGAVLDGLVGSWRDQSGNGHHAIGATLQPTLKHTADFYRCLRFSGAQRLLIASIATDAQALSGFVVSRTRKPTERNIYFAAGAGQSVYWHEGNTAELYLYNGGAGPVVPEWPAIAHGFTASDLALKYWLSGSQVSATAQSSGTYSSLNIGETTTGTYRTDDDIAEIILYNRALTDTEATRVIDRLMRKYSLSAKGKQLVFTGDSHTFGYGAAAQSSYPSQVMEAYADKVYYGYNLGISGQTTQQMIDDAATRVDPLYNTTLKKNILIAWEGQNDLAINGDAGTAYTRLVTYCQARRAAGWDVVVATILPRNTTGLYTNALRLTLNTSIRANWATFADGLADLALDGRIGDDGDQNDTNYYSDGTHLTATGLGVVAGIVKAAVDGLA